MKILLPLDKMSTAEKLSAMERLWEDLCRKPEDVPSPKWHGEVLSKREKMIREGKAGFSALEEAKNRLRGSTR